ncbi:uncharacterized protein LACBIDRAFT_332395 [Laccaria bicolor S238N-H82]|uniref:Uncharacterized protein n=1 Tax=Laccaria bicolor (strain S238N-H82 / ATCC MYA-4686) TaxID=486041 RepID=B0DSK9_LACBS|nr:uncharacterized protein LACBIDRAFT_332395 [Laccaria bicolor S238N-H82]EDR02490.1 hypothetical protein LACBIDRAFT_332395 [Laccaria bicolor S238N-H82]|eukprot:XP_001886853.1 hypothetical protein LACBIDRAFT_332395 [Laccaria bicolor S238N-H82]
MPGYPGLRHFKNGILNVSQWTGTKHKEMQHVFMGLLVGAVQPQVLRTARAVIDFIYYAQLQMMHYFASIKSRGSANRYNTEWSKRLHIDFAKEGYRASNKHDFIQQMATWLDRQEATACFGQYLDWLLRCESQEELDSEDLDNDDVDESGHEKVGHGSASHTDVVDDEVSSHSGLPATHLLAVNPGFHWVKLKDIVTQFHTTDFLTLVTRFIRCTHPPPEQPTLPNATDVFDIYKWLSIHLKDLAAVGHIGTLQRIRAMPLTLGRKHDSPENFDTVLVRSESEKGNQATKGTCLEDHLHCDHSLPQYLVYIEWFNLLRSPDPDSGLCFVTRSSHHNQPISEVVPLCNVVLGCHLIPKFSTKFSPAKWNHLKILNNWKTFSLNKYIDLATFYEHQVFR